MKQGIFRITENALLKMIIEGQLVEISKMIHSLRDKVKRGLENS